MTKNQLAAIHRVAQAFSDLEDQWDDKATEEYYALGGRKILGELLPASLEETIHNWFTFYYAMKDKQDQVKA
jgi:hypothetical protein